MLDKELGLNPLLDLTLQPLRGLPGVRQSKIHKSYNQTWGVKIYLDLQ